MPIAALSESHIAFEPPTLPQPLPVSRRPGADHDAIVGSIDLSTTQAADGLMLELQPPPRRADASNSRTITHVYEPVRDEQSEVIDFRLTFDQASAEESRRPFLGIHMVRTGDWAAPGAIFHTLKQVLNSGHSLHEMTRHVGTDQEVCFYQTANRVGDTVVTTTSIVVMVPR